MAGLTDDDRHSAMKVLLILQKQKGQKGLSFNEIQGVLKIGTPGLVKIMEFLRERLLIIPRIAPEDKRFIARHEITHRGEGILEVIAILFQNY